MLHYFFLVMESGPHSFKKWKNQVRNPKLFFESIIALVSGDVIPVLMNTEVPREVKYENIFLCQKQKFATWKEDNPKFQLDFNLLVVLNSKASQSQTQKR